MVKKQSHMAMANGNDLIILKGSNQGRGNKNVVKACLFRLQLFSLVWVMDRISLFSDQCRIFSKAVVFGGTI